MNFCILEVLSKSLHEFGSGTVSADGIGLLCAALNHFACLNSTPKVLACTHFSELSEDCFLPKVLDEKSLIKKYPEITNLKQELEHLIRTPFCTLISRVGELLFFHAILMKKVSVETRVTR